MPLDFWLLRSTANEWLGCALLLAAAWIRRPAIPFAELGFWLIAPLLCGTSYVIMATGHGQFPLPVSNEPGLRVFLLLRYLDWLFMVPSALYLFLRSAGVATRAHGGQVTTTLLCGIAMAALVLAFSALPQPTLKVLCYGAFLLASGLVYGLMRRLAYAEQRRDLVRFVSARADLRFFATLWAVYAFATLLGSDGLRFLPPSVTTATFENTDFALVIGYTLVALSRRGRTAEAQQRAERHAILVATNAGTVPARDVHRFHVTQAERIASGLPANIGHRGGVHPRASQG